MNSEAHADRSQLKSREGAATGLNLQGGQAQGPAECCWGRSSCIL